MKVVVNNFFKKISALRKSLLPPKVLDVIKTEISEHQANSLKSLVKNSHLCVDLNFFDALKTWLEENATESAKSEETYEDVEEDEEEIERLRDERETEDSVEDDWLGESDSHEETEDSVEDDWLGKSDAHEATEKTFAIDASKIDDKTFKQYFDKQMSSDETMDIETAKKITDVKSLPQRKRWSLYRLWVKLYIRTLMKAEDNIFDARVAARLRERMQELKIEEEISMLKISKDAKIIGVTTTGAAKNRALISKLKPKIVIVEEAAEILESHIITAMTTETKHLILIGDHIQLKPKPTVHELAKNYELDVSLFERLIKNQLSFSKLKIQHRMHPTISEYLVPLFYPELENHESVTKYESIKGVTKNIFFFNHSECEEVQNDGKSRYNNFESEFVFRLCQYLILQGYKSSQITVLTMYSAQMFKTRYKFKEYNETSYIRISVVDNFQGEENDIIVCSFVRSNAQGDIGFLKTPNRINVALSRAKKGFYAVGNFEMFANVSVDLWFPLVHRLKNRGCFGNKLELYCQNHPDQKILISKPIEFYQSAEGGCMKQCDYRLHCGHTCPRKCHSYDTAHEFVRCNDKCLTICCENNHRCQKKCHVGEKCPPCYEKIAKKRSCGHTLVTQCGRNVEIDICDQPCEKILRCGHQCNKRCIDDCSTAICDKMVKAKTLCGHEEVEALCGVKNDTSALLEHCKGDCNTILKCKHQCEGTCAGCRQGRLHVKCGERCDRPLICGHICKSPCSSNCPPCKRDCEHICTHGLKCKHKCGTMCIPCRKRCNFSCEHCWCINLCSEQCEQKFKKCSQKLPCSHKCRGINGYACLTVCDICEPQKFKDAKYFGQNDDNEACFIQLKTCGHLFEANGLYKHLLLNNGLDATEDQQLKCPDCGEMMEESLFNMIRSVDKTNKRLIHGCLKTLPCKHPCIGICGEQCLCRECNQAEVEKMIFGTEEDENARFVQLMPCKHIFEYSGIQKWISQAVASSQSSLDEDTSIKMIACISCKQPLNQSLVFNSEIRQIIDDIENIKKRFNGVVEANSTRRYFLIEKCLSLRERESLEVKQGKKVYSGVTRKLIKCHKNLDKTSLSNSELEMISNALKVVEEVINLSVKGDVFDEMFNRRVTDVIDFLNNQCESSNNEQQMSDLMFEINILKNYRNIFSLKGDLKSEVTELVTQAKELFHRVGRLSDEDAEKLKKIVDKAIELNGGIPKHEMKMVLKAMNFGQKGHWFKCPNGHPYCITECGGAMETGKCPECQEEIGGTSHRLVETNTIATDIDNAIMSAYDYSAIGVEYS
ncbi:NFX1-type zinc finger-containing protein 1-like isoform b precursor [Leptotrombidium deliense]|uniref:NFX1-type zinc finger-containing protein 1-like isoform b n=1 Tax=Leptotrombidium deliense TaxID=299467 RepID=A0A443S8V4_9ACAR|nr:NFX1-type zinc finger-containing protein 1-like isoform b precursor [Leptotrombidium deliense]